MFVIYSVLHLLSAQGLAQSHETTSAWKDAIVSFRLDRSPDAILNNWDRRPGEPSSSDSIEQQLQRFDYDVTRGDWSSVKEFLKSIPNEYAGALYERMLQELSHHDSPSSPVNLPSSLTIKSVLTTSDLIGILEACPVKPVPISHAESFSKCLAVGLQSGVRLDGFLESVQNHIDQSEADVSPLFLADVLVKVGQPLLASSFLPSVEEILQSQEWHLKSLGAALLEARFEETKNPGDLLNAWSLMTGLLADDSGDEVQRTALESRIFALGEKLPIEVRNKWIMSLMTSKPKLAFDLCQSLGTKTYTSLEQLPLDADQRQVYLTQLRWMLDHISRSSFDNQRKEICASVFLRSWLREAELALLNENTDDARIAMIKDEYGKVFVSEDSVYQLYSSRQAPATTTIAPLPIKVLIRVSPWLSDEANHRDEMLLLATKKVQLGLKSDEFEVAADAIKSIASTDSKEATQLADTFFRRWAQLHAANLKVKPDAQKYMVPAIAQTDVTLSIPITRSMQERNLTELQHWIVFFEAAPRVKVDQLLIAKAFVECHGAAEVYSRQSIERIFGSLEDLELNTVANLADTMRDHLKGQWRIQKTHADAKTGRSSKDIDQVVKVGYSDILHIMSKYSNELEHNWRYTLLKASLEHDRMMYEKDTLTDVELAEQRVRIFGSFATAAQQYAQTVPQIDLSQENVEIYEIWLNASLGDCDLSEVTREMAQYDGQTVLIRQAILDLRGEASERHFSRFARRIKENLITAAGAVKYAYLDSALEIVQDHDELGDIKKLFRYYSDLVKEVKLSLEIDGEDVVGHKSSFGVLVYFVHSPEIEREAGGFNRYLKVGTGSYPLVDNTDYRKMFQAASQEALAEHFEIDSILFENPSVNSRSTTESAWRRTPFAYMKLRSRTPHVDVIPAISMTLNFRDHDDMIAIPISSGIVPLDSSPLDVAIRPYKPRSITQTINSSKLDQGTMILEVSATGLGLVPELDQLLTFPIQEFEISNIDDQGIQLDEFDNSQERVNVVSSRNWKVTLASSNSSPGKFIFASSQLPIETMTYQRYEDTNIVPADSVVVLNSFVNFGQFLRPFLWLIVILMSGCVLALFLRRRSAPVVALAGIDVPQNITPFSVSVFLQRLHDDDRLNQMQKGELQENIHQLERDYFRDEKPDLDYLSELCNRWKSLEHTSPFRTR